MKPKVWMINTVGSSKFIDISLKDKYIAEGWVVIPADKLDGKGQPKQMYWPQYDRNVPGQEKIIRGEGGRFSPKNILKVEVF